MPNNFIEDNGVRSKDIGNCITLIHEFGHAISGMFAVKLYDGMYDENKEINYQNTQLVSVYDRIYGLEEYEEIADEFEIAVRSHWNLPLIPNINLRGEGVNGFQPNFKFWDFEYWR